ncbi:putative acyltransferase PWA37_000754 [Arxiozyma heterogenica]
MSLKLFRTVKQTAILLISVVVFLESCVALCFIQIITIILFKKNTKSYQKCMDFTKKYFLIMLTAILSVAAPSKVRITTCNNTIGKNVFFMDHQKGRISSTLCPDSVVICNHQIYTDWIYLWWIAYTSELAGRVHIMLKKSLKSIPLLGFGMTNFNFLFMNRKWAHDRVNLINTLKELDANARGLGPLSSNTPVKTDNDGVVNWDSRVHPDVREKKTNSNCWPYNFLLFPEGTNLTYDTRCKSLKYARKVNKQPFKHLLLPHVTGLRFTLETLEPSLDAVYDVTIGYSGVQNSSYAASHYSLKQIFLEGKFPHIVDIYIRSYELKNIPLRDEEAFAEWLYNVWKEKDELLEEYYISGSFKQESNNTSTVVDKFNVSPSEYLLVGMIPCITFLFILKLLAA